MPPCKQEQTKLNEPRKYLQSIAIQTSDGNNNQWTKSTNEVDDCQYELLSMPVFNKLELCFARNVQVFTTFSLLLVEREPQVGLRGMKIAANYVLEWKLIKKLI